MIFFIIFSYSINDFIKEQLKNKFNYFDKFKKKL